MPAGAWKEGPVMSERLLLHMCCAPCASAALPRLLADGYEVTAFFYGGNIHPREEWERRRGAVLRLVSAYGLQAVIRPYGTDEWDDAVRGFEAEPEGGARCPRCMKLQLESAARAAREVGISALCTSLTASPQKNPETINGLGQSAAAEQGLRWESRVWRKKGGFLLSLQECRRLDLYRQNYCGCRYSMGRLLTEERR